MTARFVVRFIPRMQKALKANNFSKDMFTNMEAVFFKELEFVDLMVSATISSFWNYELFKQYPSLPLILSSSHPLFVVFSYYFL